MSRYPTPDELWALTFAEANAWRDRFAAVPFEDKGGSHPSRYVLAHVAYALPPVTREERASRAKVVISLHFNSKQQVFLDFVLSHYVRVGVEELDQEKLTPLLRLKYHHSIADALADLGRAEEIGRVFAGFQKYLYQQQAAA